MAATVNAGALIPGPGPGRPILASISNLPRLVWGGSGRAHVVHIELHQKYGNLVRLGPNCISVGDPLEVPKIYGTSTSFGKASPSDFYKTLQPMIGGRRIPGLFHTQDNEVHRALKKPIAGIYSMTNLVEFEPRVDSTIRFLLQRLDETQQGDPSGSVDLGTWLQWFAFDVMGEITFSKRLGFLDEGRDIEGIMGSIWDGLVKVSYLGQMPWLELIWLKNPYVNRLRKAKNSPIVSFGQQRARERANVKPQDGSEGPEEPPSAGAGYNSKDFLSRFLDIRAKDPGAIPEWYITVWTQSNMFAGSDTTAIMLRTIIYHLIKNPATLAKLTSELAAARRAGRLPSAIVSWRETRELPYLDACVKEAGRLHPVIGLALERVVPRGGADICGQRFAEGTVVGINPWVVHRNKELYGEDADRWNPDRWLLCDKERRVAMERCLLTFGSGHRICLGKNISYLEIYKLIPTLFLTYEISLSNPNQDWVLSNHWLVTQKGLDVKLKRRDLAADLAL
ncbi:cytochrome P450 [Podospora appendiculata]|uniref:Cytochrome P450 n=1 Tax=Podospora appendiculata TaxID=314037 RepID=A0AAE0WYY2_9PEZI|nr:cytochrome P450 [Podospora appendiculata]